ncbi:MAG: DUF2147 domain-containing protein [Rhodothalassiaceae bacterium]
MVHRTLALLIGLFAFAGLAAAAPGTDSPEAIVGIWQSDSGKSRIEIQPCPDGESFCGHIVWTRSGNPAYLGATVLEGLQYKNGRWVKGAIHDPRNGSTYRAKAVLESPDRLRVKGCLLVFCDSRIWTRHPVDGLAASPAVSQDETS